MKEVTFVKNISLQERDKNYQLAAVSSFSVQKYGDNYLVRIHIVFIANQHVIPLRFVAPVRAPVGTTARITDE